VQERTENAANKQRIAEPFQRAFPNRHGPRDLRVFGEPVRLRLIGTSQNIDDMRAADAGRIVHSCRIEPVRFENRDAVLRFSKQILARTETQAVRRAGFDAGRLESHRNAVGAERALLDFLGFRVELGHVEGTARHAVATTDTCIAVEIDDPVTVLNDRARGRASLKTARIHAVHALIFRHQPKRLAVQFGFVEFDQIPKIMGQIGQRLVRAFEIPKRHLLVVPFLAGYFACLAADAGCGVNQLRRRLRGSGPACRFARGCRNRLDESGHHAIECELPFLAKERWLRPLRKCREATLVGADGVVRSRELFWSLNEPPRPRLSKERGYFLMARPPLLCQGGEFASRPQLRQQSYVPGRFPTFISSRYSPRIPCTPAFQNLDRVRSD